MASVGVATAPASGAGQGQAAQVVAAAQKMAAGAKWFYWIAGLSLVNVVLSLAKAPIRFIFGMGITEIVTAYGERGGGTGTVAALVVTLFIAGICAAFGALALKRHAWVFWLGMLLYTCDGLILLLFQDFLGAAFHLWVLFRLFQGAMALNQLKQLTANTMSATPVTAKPIA